MQSPNHRLSDDDGSLVSEYFHSRQGPVTIRIREWNSKDTLFKSDIENITDADDLDCMRMGVWNVAIGSCRWQ